MADRFVNWLAFLLVAEATVTEEVLAVTMASSTIMGRSVEPWMMILALLSSMAVNYFAIRRFLVWKFYGY